MCVGGVECTLCSCLPWLSAMGECPRERACACVHQLGVVRPHPFPPARPRPEPPHPHPSLVVRPSLLPRPPSPGHRARSPGSQTRARTRHPLTCSMLRPLCCPPRAGPRGRRGRRPLHVPWPGSCTRRPRATPGAPGLRRPSPPRRGLRPATGSALRGLRCLPRPGWGPRSTSSHFTHADTGHQLREVSHSITHTVHPRASHIQGLLLPPPATLPVLGSCPWREDSGSRGKTLVTFLRLAKSRGPHLSFHRLQKGTWTREPRGLWQS